tara:strand:+ start:140 stop:442 length:303 start_codon:yes stop_codon:yes gene_type:complete
MKKTIKLTEEKLVSIIHKVLNEGDITPGTHPELFYDDDFRKMKEKYGGVDNDNEDELEGELNMEELGDDIVEVYSLLQDGATDMAISRLEYLLYKIGRFQ